MQTTMEDIIKEECEIDRRKKENGKKLGKKLTPSCSIDIPAIAAVSSTNMIRLRISGETTT